MIKELKQVHVVSTGEQSAEVFMKIILAIHPYIDAVHIRERTWSAAKIVEVIRTLSKGGVPLYKIIVNDRVDLACVMKISGVHLAKHSIDVSDVKNTFPTLRTGCSVHSLKEARMVQEKQADYCMYGHIFSTAKKAARRPRGIEKLKALVKGVRIPVIAIGGISENNMNHVLQTGVDGIAMMSGILLADNPLETVKRIRRKMDNKEGIHEGKY